MRVALAGILFTAPDLLLLDEPTNYLDLEACCGWRSSQKYRGTMLIVSHDRDLLNTVCEFIVHIEQREAEAYTGGYDIFERPAPSGWPTTPPSRQDGAAQAHADLRRPLQGEGDQGAPGAEPHEDDREDRADRGSAARREGRASTSPRPSCSPRRSDHGPGVGRL